MAQKSEDNEIAELKELLFYGACCLDDFLKLPRKTQELFFTATLLTEVPPWYEGEVLTVPQPSMDVASPIESILEMAFRVYEMNLNKNYYFFECQYEVDLENGKHYVVDFYINKVNLIVECDGHEFHEKTKEQVARDNEREYDLKMAGYNILRFSGSQIYNKPFECAKELYTYIEKLRKE